jgi:hypothetical protein
VAFDKFRSLIQQGIDLFHILFPYRNQRPWNPNKQTLNIQIKDNLSVRSLFAR